MLCQIVSRRCLKDQEMSERCQEMSERCQKISKRCQKYVKKYQEDDVKKTSIRLPHPSDLIVTNKLLSNN